MDIKESHILRAAQLAKLQLSDNEKHEFHKQLTDIIKYVEKLNELHTENVAPADHIVELSNVFREDKTVKSLDIAEIEMIAPKFADGHFIVPKIIE